MDFETGGYFSQKNAITEFAGIWIESDDMSEIDRFDSLLKPYDDSLIYTPEALKATNIKLEMLVDGCETSELVEIICLITEEANKSKTKHKKTILVGHNIGFDIGFLQAVFKREKVDLSKFFAGYIDYEKNFQPSYIDTMYLSRNKNPLLNTHTLTDACIREDVELSGAHRAMNDVEATLDLFKKYSFLFRNGTSDLSEDDNFKYEM